MATRPKARARLSDAAIFERVRSILINAADGQRSIADDREYKDLRNQWRKRSLFMPAMVSTHPTVDSFMASIKGLQTKAERVDRVQEEFENPLADDNVEGPTVVESVGWTGNPDRVARLKVVREVLPLARSTIETMIEELSKPGPNNGPLLDEKEDALRHLRELHRALGDLLTEIEGGRFDNDLGQGLAAEVVRLTRNVRDNLRDEPLPCALAALMLGIFTAGGMPVVGGFLSDATFHLTRKRTEKGAKHGRD